MTGLILEGAEVSCSVHRGDMSFSHPSLSLMFREHVTLSREEARKILLLVADTREKIKGVMEAVLQFSDGVKMQKYTSNEAPLFKWLLKVMLPLAVQPSTVLSNLWIMSLECAQAQIQPPPCRANVPRERPPRSAPRGPLPTCSPCSTSLRSRSSRRRSTWSTRTETGSLTRRICTTCWPLWVKGFVLRMSFYG